MEKYLATAYEIAAKITQNYSTSFYSASCLYDKRIRPGIFAIYGFVRCADEIVDTFHGYDKAKLLAQFESDYYQALEEGISLNPVLHAFQDTVRRYEIPDQYIQAFLGSMRRDLKIQTYNSKAEIDAYIYGSAEVVGLMCLKLFCNDNLRLFSELEASAGKLGAAFQKVNFLRDLQEDTQQLARCYFPCLIDGELNEEKKQMIIREIESDFQEAYQGIKRLPAGAKLPVYIAYCYYKKLLEKIKYTQALELKKRRIRISNGLKFSIMLKASLYYKLDIL